MERGKKLKREREILQRKRKTKANIVEVTVVVEFEAVAGRGGAKPREMVPRAAA